jgi:hypothetical protein
VLKLYFITVLCWLHIVMVHHSNLVVVHKVQMFYVISYFFLTLDIQSGYSNQLHVAWSFFRYSLNLNDRMMIVVVHCNPDSRSHHQDSRSRWNRSVPRSYFVSIFFIDPTFLSLMVIISRNNFELGDTLQTKWTRCSDWKHKSTGITSSLCKDLGSDESDWHPSPWLLSQLFLKWTLWTCCDLPKPTYLLYLEWSTRSWADEPKCNSQFLALVTQVKHLFFFFFFHSMQHKVYGTDSASCISPDNLLSSAWISVI